MRLFLQILIFLFTCFTSSTAIDTPKIVVPTNTSTFQKTEKTIHSEKVKIGVQQNARSSLEEQQAQTTTFHQTTCSLLTYLEAENFCALDFQKTIDGGMIHSPSLVQGGFVTELELQMILRNQSWLDKVVFHQSQTILSNAEIIAKKLTFIGN